MANKAIDHILGLPKKGEQNAKTENSKTLGKVKGSKFSQIWGKYRYYFIGGAAALILLLYVLFKKKSTSTTTPTGTTVPNTGGGSGGGGTTQPNIPGSWGLPTYPGTPTTPTTGVTSFPPPVVTPLKKVQQVLTTNQIISNLSTAASKLFPHTSLASSPGETALHNQANALRLQQLLSGNTFSSTINTTLGQQLLSKFEKNPTLQNAQNLADAGAGVVHNGHLYISTQNGLHALGINNTPIGNTNSIVPSVSHAVPSTVQAVKQDIASATTKSLATNTQAVPSKFIPHFNAMHFGSGVLNNTNPSKTQLPTYFQSHFRPVHNLPNMIQQHLGGQVQYTPTNTSHVTTNPITSYINRSKYHYKPPTGLNGL